MNKINILLMQYSCDPSTDTALQCIELASGISVASKNNCINKDITYYLFVSKIMFSVSMHRIP